MQISASINRKNLNEITIKSLVWNSLVDFFLNKKDIDLKPYLVSIKLRGKIISVKLTKNIIKSEILLYEREITEKIGKKLDKIGLKISDFEIKYFV